MDFVTASEARRRLCRLIDEVIEPHHPPVITGKRHHAVLVSSEDWSALQEVLHLARVPGMNEFIQEGMATPHGRPAERLGLFRDALRRHGEVEHDHARADAG